jgi:hypothetical protein
MENGLYHLQFAERPLLKQMSCSLKDRNQASHCLKSVLISSFPVLISLILMKQFARWSVISSPVSLSLGAPAHVVPALPLKRGVCPPAPSPKVCLLPVGAVDRLLSSLACQCHLQARGRFACILTAVEEPMPARRCAPTLAAKGGGLTPCVALLLDSSAWKRCAYGDAYRVLSGAEKKTRTLPYRRLPAVHAAWKTRAVSIWARRRRISKSGRMAAARVWRNIAAACARRLRIVPLWRRISRRSGANNGVISVKHAGGISGE